MRSGQKWLQNKKILNKKYEIWENATYNIKIPDPPVNFKLPGTFSGKGPGDGEMILAKGFDVVGNKNLSEEVKE